MDSSDEKYQKILIVAIIQLLILILFTIFGCSNEELSPISNIVETTNNSKLQDESPIRYINTAFTSCEDAADIHKAMVDSMYTWYDCLSEFYTDIDNYYDEMLDQHFPDWTPPTVFDDWVDDFSTNFDSLYFENFNTCLDSGLVITRRYLYKAIIDGKISSDIGDKIDHIFDLLEASAPADTVDAKIDLLVNYTEENGTEPEICVVGVFYGSRRDYYQSDWWLELADVGGGLIGAGMGGGVGAIIGAGLVSACYSKYIGNI